MITFKDFDLPNPSSDDFESCLLPKGNLLFCWTGIWTGERIVVEVVAEEEFEEGESKSRGGGIFEDEFVDKLFVTVAGVVGAEREEDRGKEGEPEEEGEIVGEGGGEIEEKEEGLKGVGIVRVRRSWGGLLGVIPLKLFEFSTFELIFGELLWLVVLGIHVTVGEVVKLLGFLGERVGAGLVTTLEYSSLGAKKTKIKIKNTDIRKLKGSYMLEERLDF